jgi:hypothetical protein
VVDTKRESNVSRYPDHVPAKELSFNPAEAFPAGDPMSLPLLRLMAATNDALLNQKRTIVAREQAGDLTDLDRSVLNGELGYYVRMLYGHLFEAGIAFRQLDDALGSQIDEILKDDKEAMAALQRLREVYRDTSEDGFNRTVLVRVRNLAAFHYKETQFKEGVTAFGITDSQIIISPHRGIGRYIVTDQIMNRSVWEFVGGTMEKFSASLEKAISLADSLGVTVSHLVAHRFEQRGIRITTREGTLRIEPEVNRMRQKVEEKRRARS